MTEFEYEDVAMSHGTKTFAKNLWMLLDLQGKTKADLCNHAGISRTQLNRFLSGSSYPKPAILVKICALFDVDARILTNLIVPCSTAASTLARHYEEIWEFLLDFGAFSPDQSPSKYIPPDQNDVEDGLYRYWVPDAIDLGIYYNGIARISTNAGVRLLESRELLSDWGDMPKPRDRSPRNRGVCYKQVNGFCTLQFIGNSHMKFFLSFERMNRFHADCYGGTALWTKDGTQAPFLIQPVVMERIPSGLRNAVRAAYDSGRCELKQIPDFARAHFEKIRTGASRFFEVL